MLAVRCTCARVSEQDVVVLPMRAYVLAAEVAPGYIARLGGLVSGRHFPNPGARVPCVGGEVDEVTAEDGQVLADGACAGFVVFDVDAVIQEVATHDMACGSISTESDTHGRAVVGRVERAIGDVPVGPVIRVMLNGAAGVFVASYVADDDGVLDVDAGWVVMKEKAVAAHHRDIARQERAHCGCAGDERLPRPQSECRVAISGRAAEVVDGTAITV